MHLEPVPHPKSTKSNSSRNHPLRRSTRRSPRPSVTQPYHHQRGSNWLGQGGRIGTSEYGREVPRSWLEPPIGRRNDGATYAHQSDKVTGSGRGSFFRRPTVLTSDLILSERRPGTALVLGWYLSNGILPAPGPQTFSHQTQAGIQPGWPLSWSSAANAGLECGWTSSCFGRSGPSMLTIWPPISSQHLEHVTKPPTQHHLANLSRISFRKRTHARIFHTYGDGEVIPSLMGSGRS